VEKTYPTAVWHKKLESSQQLNAEKKFSGLHEERKE